MMNDLGIYLGRDGESARGWVYDDGLVVWVASADESLVHIRSEFGDCCCVAVSRYDSLPDAVVVIEGEPDSLMDRTSECLSAIVPDGLPYADCRSTSIERLMVQAMGFQYPWFRVDCRIPRPVVKEQVIHIDREVINEVRRLLQSVE